MKNYNFMRFYFGKERCHLQSEVKRNYVMAPKMALKVTLKVAPKINDEASADARQCQSER